MTMPIFRKIAERFSTVLWLDPFSVRQGMRQFDRRLNPYCNQQNVTAIYD